MFTKRNNRRHFLKLAAGMLAAPIGSPLLSLSARAQTNTKAPLRLLTTIDTYGLPLDTRNDVWVRSSNGNYVLKDSDLGTVLQPLKAYRDNLLVLSGSAMPTGPIGGIGGHHNIIHTLGGSGYINGQKKAGAKISHASFDYMVGQFLNNDYGLPSDRLYPHLCFSDMPDTAHATFAYDNSGNEIRTIAGAKNAVERLFGDSFSPSPGVDVVEQAEVGARADVLRLVSSQVRDLKAQLANERYNTAMDAYDASVNDLAKELELRLGSACTIPAEFGNFINMSRGSPENRRSETLKVIAQLFACDMVSSASYNFGSESINANSHGFLYNDDYNSDSLRKLLNTNYHAPSHSNSDDANKTHELVRQHQMQLVADFIDTLSATPDIDGNTVFDNTVVFCTSSMSYNTHKLNEFAILVIAGKNTNLKGGFHYDCSNRTNQDVMTTVAQGLTLPIDRFGGFNRQGQYSNSTNNGPIEAMLKQVLT